MTRKTLCLNMIVKNESHVIGKTLKNLCDKIKFDYYAISDTGSTDDTIKIIKDFFIERDIPGEISNDEWVDFGHNRTVALELAFGKTDYLMIFDADDEIVGNIPSLDNLDKDQYLLKFGPNFIMYRPLIINNRTVEWKFECPLHEFLTTKKESLKITRENIEGNYHLISGRSGARSQDPLKYFKDGEILSKAFEKDNGRFKDRYSYYAAQSYKDANKPELAVKWYKICLSLNGGWSQEKYIACLDAYHTMVKLNQQDEGIHFLYRAYRHDMHRVECMYFLIEYYVNNLNLFPMAYAAYYPYRKWYENEYLEIKYPHEGKFIYNNAIHDFLLPTRLIFVGGVLGELKTVVNAYNVLFEKKYESLYERDNYERNIFNLQFTLDNINSFESKADRTTFIKKANNYIKYIVFEKKLCKPDEKLLNEYSKKYNMKF